MQHPQHGASIHRPRRLRVKRAPVEKAMPYVTALPLVQERASAEASEGASPHRSTQSGQCTVQPDRARDSVPVLAGTRHPQPAQSAGYLLERGLFRVCMVCFWFGVVRVLLGAVSVARNQRILCFGDCFLEGSAFAFPVAVRPLEGTVPIGGWPDAGLFGDVFVAVVCDVVHGLFLVFVY